MSSSFVGSFFMYLEFGDPGACGPPDSCLEDAYCDNIYGQIPCVCMDQTGDTTYEGDVFGHHIVGTGPDASGCYVFTRDGTACGTVCPSAFFGQLIGTLQLCEANDCDVTRWCDISVRVSIVDMAYHYICDNLADYCAPLQPSPTGTPCFPDQAGVFNCVPDTLNVHIDFGTCFDVTFTADKILEEGITFGKNCNVLWQGEAQIADCANAEGNTIWVRTWFGEGGRPFVDVYVKWFDDFGGVHKCPIAGFYFENNCCNVETVSTDCGTGYTCDDCTYTFGSSSCSLCPTLGACSPFFYQANIFLIQNIFSGCYGVLGSGGCAYAQNDCPSTAGYVDCTCVYSWLQGCEGTCWANLCAISAIDFPVTGTITCYE